MLRSSPARTPSTLLTRAVVVASSIGLACVLAAGDASAGSPDEATKEAARQAYDRGAAAYDAGDYARATAELTHADELFASDVALELALKSAVKGDDPLAAMTLAARADKRARGGTLAAAAQAARAKMAGRTGTVNVTCPGRATCLAKIDGKDVPANEPYVVLAGPHRVIIEGGGAPREAYDVRVDSDAAVVVKALVPVPVIGPPPGPRPASEPASRAEPRSSGISPAWFFVGLGVTAVVGGITIASALDTRKKHDEFQTRPSMQAQQAGLDAQLRTNLLTGGTAVAAVTTALLGLLFVQWSSSPSPSSSGAYTAVPRAAY